jgi:GTP-binding protein
MDIRTAEFVKSSSSHKECPAGQLPEFAFIGRSNVGKSSLINLLTGKKGLAKTSSTPGKTTLINHFLINKNWYLVDLPGYGFAKVSKTAKEKFNQMIEDYFESRSNLINTYLLIDCRHKPMLVDLSFMEWLASNGRSFTIVFTKTDKLTKNQLQQAVQQYRNEMLKTWEEFPPFLISSVITNLGRQDILDDITALISEN